MVPQDEPHTANRFAGAGDFKEGDDAWQIRLRGVWLNPMDETLEWSALRICALSYKQDHSVIAAWAESSFTHKHLAGKGSQRPEKLADIGNAAPASAFEWNTFCGKRVGA